MQDTSQYAENKHMFLHVYSHSAHRGPGLLWGCPNLRRPVSFPSHF